MKLFRLVWPLLCMLVGGLMFPAYAAAAPVLRVSHLTVVTGLHAKPNQAQLQWVDSPSVTAITIRTGGVTSEHPRIQGYSQYEQFSGTYRFCITPSSGARRGRTKCISATVSA